MNIRETFPRRVVLLLSAAALLLTFIYPATWAKPFNIDDARQEAQQLQDSLQGIEWYTEECFRKALLAEKEGDAARATEFGKKAIESDQKADGLRDQVAAAWIRAGETSQVRQLWLDAAGTSRHRAEVLAARLPGLNEQEKASASRLQRARKDIATTKLREQWLFARAVYIEGLYYTAQQWVRTAEFSAKANELADRDILWQRVQLLSSDLIKLSSAEVVALVPRMEPFVADAKRWQAQSLQTASTPDID